MRRGSRAPVTEGNHRMHTRARKRGDSCHPIVRDAYAWNFHPAIVSVNWAFVVTTFQTFGIVYEINEKRTTLLREPLRGIGENVFRLPWNLVWEVCGFGRNEIKRWSIMF